MVVFVKKKSLNRLLEGVPPRRMPLLEGLSLSIINISDSKFTMFIHISLFLTGML